MVSIIILSYNTKSLLRSCLSSLLEHLRGFGFEILVFDNASSDGSVQMIKKEFTKAKVIESQENLGFAKGCNLGAKNSKGKYILFLNSDTQVLDNGFISMIEFMDKNPKVAILGGKLENSAGSIQPSAGKFYTLYNLIIMLLGLERLGLLRSSP